MTNASFASLRRHALAVATVAVLGMPLAAGATGVSESVRTAYAGRVNFALLAQGESYDGFIVYYKAHNMAGMPTGQRRVAEVQRLNQTISRVAVAAGRNLAYDRQIATGGHLVRMAQGHASSEEAERLMVELAKDPDIAVIEPNRRMHAFLAPNDTRFGEQWDLSDPVGGINMPSAWDVATGSGVIVAVVDTGITPHSDLAGQTIGGYDFIADAAEARDKDGRDANPNDEGDWHGMFDCGFFGGSSKSSWHGTHVAGTIAAVTNNAKGVAGIAYNAKVEPIRVLGRCGGSLADITDAMIWAAGGSVPGVPANPHPAKVVNLSLGGGGTCSTTEQAAIDSVRAHGAVMVVAAGNDGSDVAQTSPASCPGVIAVAATTKSGSLASYSNYGSLIDVSAPGGDGSHGAGDILSTLNAGSNTQGAEAYAYYAGTSMAAPHVAGLAALMFSKNPSLTPDQVESVMKANARPLPGGCSRGCGAGLIDAKKTLDAVPPMAGGNSPPVADFTASANGLVINFTDGSSDSDGSIVARAWNFGDGGSSTAANPSHTYAAAGTYSVSLTVTDDKGATATKTRSLTLSSGGTPGGGYDNPADVAIPDLGSASSTISVAGIAGNAPAVLKVKVKIVHPYRGDLEIDLIAPDGAAYRLKNASIFEFDEDLNATYKVDASASPASGVWTLKISDKYSGDAGYLDDWGLTF